jgi:hypothetical protein
VIMFVMVFLPFCVTWLVLGHVPCHSL